MKALRILPLAVCLYTLSGCGFLGGDETPDAGPSDAGCATPCGTSCCAAGQVCKSGACAAPCSPSCGGKQCGDDGCGGSCGECGGTKVCNDSTGQCENCTPNCTNKECGSDGCGGTCAPNSCGAGTSCQSGKCMACQPQCAGKVCGPNGCGGTCGGCAAGVCDTGAGQCVGCFADADCATSPNGAKCDTAKKQCVPCLQNTDCRQDGSITCDPSTHTCQVTCTSSTECAAVTGAHQCNTVTGKCVPCLTSSDCTSPTAPTCNTNTNTCLYCLTGQDCDRITGGARGVCKNSTSCVQCTQNTDCTNAGLGNACDTATNTCVECTGNAECGGLFCSAQKKCVECLSNANCTNDPQAKVCSSQNACVMCAGDGDCGQYAGGLKRCLQGTCYQCTQNADCPGTNATCNPNHTCGFAAPANDTCSAPKALTFTNDVATDAGDLTNANGNYSTTCGSGGAGKDVVYSFTLPTTTATRRFTVEVTPVGSWIPYVQLRSSTCNGSSIGCAQATTGGGVVSYSYTGTGGVTYYAIVDSDNAAVGPFRIKVTLAPSNENCGTAKLLTIPGSNTLTFSSSTKGAANDTSMPAQSCSSGAISVTGPDLVYYFMMTSSGTVKITVTAQGSSSYIPVVYANYSTSSSGCTSGTPFGTVACDNGPAGGSASITSSYLTASTTSPKYVFFAIDGSSSTSGDFSVTVEAPGTGPTTETSCSNSVDDDGDGLTDCQDPDCSGDPACLPSTETNCTNRLDDDGDGKTDCLDPDCSGDPACQTATTETNCNDGVDDDGDGSPDCADTDCDNVAPCQKGGESCASTIPTLPAFVQDTKSTSPTYGYMITEAFSTTANALDNLIGTCGGTGGKDLIYKFTLSAAATNLFLAVQPIPASSSKPMVYLRSASCTGTQLMCAADTTSAGYAFTQGAAAAGTYYVVVDESTSASGGFFLQVGYF